MGHFICYIIVVKTVKRPNMQFSHIQHVVFSYMLECGPHSTLSLTLYIQIPLSFSPPQLNQTHLKKNTLI